MMPDISRDSVLRSFIETYHDFAIGRTLSDGVETLDELMDRLSALARMAEYVLEKAKQENKSTS
jgi:hypothetical protein